MKLMKKSVWVVGVCAFVIGAMSVPGFCEQAADYSKILGLWDLEVNAGGQYFYFKLTLETAEGILSGKVGENSGMFADLPLDTVEFDGEKLTFEVKAPTPPDGSEKVWKGDLKVDADRLAGTVYNAEIGAVSVTGKRQSSGSNLHI